MNGYDANDAAADARDELIEAIQQAAKAGATTRELEYQFGGEYGDDPIVADALELLDEMIQEEALHEYQDRRAEELLDEEQAELRALLNGAVLVSRRPGERIGLGELLFGQVAA